MNEIVATNVLEMAKTSKSVKVLFQKELRQPTIDIREETVSPAERAARDAIEKSHNANLAAAQSLSKVAGEARKEAWRYFGGFLGMVNLYVRYRGSVWRSANEWN